MGRNSNPSSFDEKKLTTNQLGALFEAYGNHLANHTRHRDDLLYILNTRINHILKARIDPPMLEARLYYAARGWPTFPAPADGSKKSIKTGERNDSPSKIYGPLMRWDATTNAHTIRNDFRKWPNQNIGIVTGIESGIFVVETDTKEHGDNINGEAALKAWEAEHGALPETLMARSPSGSIHRFFKHPSIGIKIKNVSGIIDGVDVRGNGGMVIGVPSYRPPRPATDDKPAKAGGIYGWINAGHAIADATAALLELVIEKPPVVENVYNSKKDVNNFDPDERKAQSFERLGQASGGGDWAYVNQMALADLSKWVPSLIPAAKPYKNGYRVSSKDLGRDLEEDLSIMPNGIVDFGVADMGDPNKGKRSAIDLVMEYLNCSKFEAVDWMRDKLGLQREPDDDGTPDSTPEAESIKATKAADAKQPKKKKDVGVTRDDFYALMPMHSYIFVPSREMWPASSVNNRIPAQQLFKNGKPVLKDGKPLKDKDGKPIKDKKGNPKFEQVEVFIPANLWLDQNKPVEQMTWAPSLPLIIKDRLISEGGWIERDGVSTFNMYRPPSIKLGDAKQATKWIDLVKKVYPNDADEIFNFCAHRRQKPEDKINHSLILGGNPGIGKDTILEAVKQAVGPWNFREVSPQDVMGSWNDYIKSVVLRISEVRDLGEVNRYSFYEHTKTLTAAPPDVMRCNTKYIAQHYVLNICGVVFTTNYKTNGIYLPADDRRTYVAWSDLTQGDFKDGFWKEFWRWYQQEDGFAHVTAWLTERDISNFDAKAPPIKTPAFWAIVDANAAPEESELADVLDAMNVARPFNATTVIQVTGNAESAFQEWLLDRRNRKAIPYRFEKCGFVPVRNGDAKDGLWLIGGKRQAVYARQELSLQNQIIEARKLALDFTDMNIS